MKICPNCGKSFLPKVTWQIYCSDKCKQHVKYLRRKGQTLLFKRTCPVCGKEFETYLLRQKCCSRKCYDEFRFKETLRRCIRLYRQKKSSPNLRTCEFCGKTFEAESPRKFCSAKCRIDSGRKVIANLLGRSNKVDDAQPMFEKFCKACGKKFKTKNKNQIYCSKNCYDFTPSLTEQSFLGA